jgi:hypothetical protein
MSKGALSVEVNYLGQKRDQAPHPETKDKSGWSYKSSHTCAMMVGIWIILRLLFFKTGTQYVLVPLYNSSAL